MTATGAKSDIFAGGLINFFGGVAPFRLGANVFAGSFPGWSVAGLLTGKGVGNFVQDCVHTLGKRV